MTLKAYSRYSYDLPALQQALNAARTAPPRSPVRDVKVKRKLAVAIGPDRVAQMVQDCERGMSQDAVARTYGVSQSSVSKYVLTARRQSRSGPALQVLLVRPPNGAR